MFSIGHPWFYIVAPLIEHPYHHGIRGLTCERLSLCEILALLLAPADVQEVEEVLEDGRVGLAVVQARGLHGARNHLQVDRKNRFEIRARTKLGENLGFIQVASDVKKNFAAIALEVGRVKVSLFHFTCAEASRSTCDILRVRGGAVVLIVLLGKFSY